MSFWLCWDFAGLQLSSYVGMSGQAKPTQPIPISLEVVMLSNRLKFLYKLGVVILLISGVFLLTACGGSESVEEGHSEEMEMEHKDEGEEMDQDHEEGMDEHGRGDIVMIPNDGASILITAPGGNATFSPDEDVLVEIAVDNFVLGEEGNHWHVYVDDVSYGMVMGGRTEQALRGLEPGEHTISVYLSNGGHEELMEGDSIIIEVKE